MLKNLFFVSLNGLRFSAFALLIAFMPLLNFALNVGAALCALAAIVAMFIAPPHLFWFSVGISTLGALGCAVVQWGYSTLVHALDPVYGA